MSYPVYGKTFVKEIKIADKTIKIEIGKFSEQVAGAVMVTCGETVVHSTVALGREVDLGYFPMSVEFIEKLYAGGLIKGSRWVKRDGRPTDDAILKARVIDRTMRPLFPEGIKNEVQVINTIFSYDNENDPDMLGLLGTAIAFSISKIPFKGPIAGLRVGYNKEAKKFSFNPVDSERENNDLDLIVSGSKDAIVMVEAGAKEVDEQVVIDAMVKAQEELGKACDQIDAIVKEIGKEKVVFGKDVGSRMSDLESIEEQIAKKYSKEINEIVNKTGRLEDGKTGDFLDKLVEEFNPGEEEVVSKKELGNILHNLEKAEARRMILEDEIRPDGRKTDDIRQIWCEVDLFTRTHGSAMFKRGATQAISITTLGNPDLGQHIDDMRGEEVRHYLHHYNMPPYASGEAGRVGYPKRREIGHGALAERALLPMIPSQEEFPYTIHVVSEIMSSNGSTSQASVCGSTMSLMAAGVPIKKPVAGIAMGLMSDGKKYVVLSDIQGLEDHVGDMDFKIAGSKDGITAIQMDIKLTGLPLEVLKKALAQAKVGRLHIMDEMLKCISEPRKELSKHAPKVAQITIPAEKIGELIGPGGKVIKDIIAKTGAEVSVDEDEEKKLGIVNISSPEQENIDKAMAMVEGITKEINEGDEFDGKVTRVEGYGIFVEIAPNKDGLVHVSAMSTDYVDDASKLHQIGDEVHVRVSEVKDDGKIGLSMLTKEQEEASRAGGRNNGNPSPSSRPRSNSRFNDRRGGYSDRGRRPQRSEWKSTLE
jgi:polyribonucleotide nucleotidyltransferase